MGSMTAGAVSMTARAVSKTVERAVARTGKQTNQKSVRRREESDGRGLGGIT